MRTISLAAVLALALVASGSCGFDNVKKYRINSPAMKPTLTEGDIVTADMIEPGEYRPHAGDLVVFDAPGSWGAEPGDPPRIHRVIAVPGDTVSCCDPAGRVLHNGAALKEPYIAANGEPPVTFDPLTVPDGHIFVLGDNRGIANDSAYNGPLALTGVIGVLRT
ncbi:signal peptidase I [Actinoplanes sp. NPDC023801]|uniref:signal peptidase I n=1 Tax=Actinoplanes sp. NPDC023801 TaxID=3154595 RepID=UPI0033EFC81F